MRETMSSLASLAATVASKTATLSHHLGVENIPEPTLTDVKHTGYDGESSELRQTRYDLARAAKNLLLLAQGPEDTVLSLFWSAIDTSNIDILLRFGFFDKVPLETEISATELSAKVDLPLDITERVVRFAISNGLFTENEPGIFTHSAASAALARSAELRAVGRMAAGPLTSMTVRVADALEIQQAGRNGKTKSVFSGQSHLGPEDPAFCLAFPGYGDAWEMAHANKEFAEVGHAYMRDQGSTSRMKNEHLLKARDWSNIGAARIVDVGGSIGHTSIALAHSMPQASFIVKDANTAALDQGRALVSEQFPELTSRVSFEEYDFFKPMSADTAGDFYLFQWILHDWNDEDSIRILKNLVLGLKPGARVLIAEAVRPAPPAGLANTLDEKLVLLQDMTMLAAHNARERSVAEFIKLFGAADSRFHYVSASGGVDGAYRSLLEFEFRA